MGAFVEELGRVFKVVENENMLPHGADMEDVTWKQLSSSFLASLSVKQSQERTAVFFPPCGIC